MRETRDAVRSLRRHLALVLGAGRPPLATARRLRPPSGGLLDAAALAGAYGVWTGLNEANAPAEAQLANAAAAAGLVRVPILQEGRKWFVTPPLTRRRASDGALIASATSEDTYSPGLIRGAVDVDAARWELLMGLSRYAFDLRFDTPAPGSRPYRIRPLAVDPAAAATAAGLPLGSAAVAADDLPPAEDWDVRGFHDAGEFEYPLAVVKTVGATATRGTSRELELTQPFVIYLYPTPPERATANPTEARLAAERVRDLAILAFRGREQGAHPSRIPLYDYDGLESEHGSSQREPHDYLSVADFSAEVAEEPGDPLLKVVVCDLRLSWYRGVEPPRGARTVDEVRLTIDVE